MSKAVAAIQDKAIKKLQAEVFEENGVSLGSYVTDNEDRLIIGSSQRADLVVPHGAVSQIHAMLRIVDDKDILLYDLGSDGGTYVAGTKIVERRLNPGEFFEIGGHRVKVNLLEQVRDAMGSEKALFWKPGLAAKPDYLEMIRLEDSLVRDERTLSNNGRIIVGRRKSEIFVEGAKAGSALLQRKDSSSSHNVDCFLPLGMVAEIYDQNNDLVRVIEQEGTVFTFNHTEKARLISADERIETLIYWRQQGTRAKRLGADADSPTLQKAGIICATVAAILLAFVSYVPLKKEALEEATIPKSSYTRTTMTAAPAAAPAPAQAEGAKSDAPAKQQQPASKVANISSSLSKLLNKKSALTAESINQAISKNGTQTSRDANLKSGSIQTTEIAAGAVGGSVNVNAMSAGLAGGSGKAGALKGFAGGQGTQIGAGNFAGKGFDMSLGGEEAEAVGGLDKSLIAAVVQANIGQIKHCYERQLIVDPNIFGKVVANWTINKDGLVSVSSIKTSTMNSKPVENCIAGKIKNWNFPKPKGGGQVLVSYPFMFKSLN
jgi:pSer/pThr/pTyr-binding forkhead associated (FHA) protein